MTKWKIVTDTGVDMGIYEAETAADALDAMARDAGYADATEAAEAVGPFEGKIEEVED